MPTFLIPKRSGVHRTAAVALYRALLTQCKAISLPSSQQDGLRNLVRNRFKQSQHVHSLRRLRISFEAGYEAIDLLDNAVAGNEESKNTIVSLLERAPARSKEAPRPARIPKRLVTKTKAKEQRSDDPSGDDHPQTSIFDRPLPLEKLSGKRHVPVLFSANRIPVLRIKKPQPASLSQYIYKRVLQRQKWHNQRLCLMQEQQLAGYEDEWDDIVGEENNTTEGVGIAQAMAELQITREPDWTEAIREALDEVYGKLAAEKEKNRIMAEKMQAVVDREQALFDRERRERREAKQRARLEQSGQPLEDAAVFKLETPNGATSSEVKPYRPFEIQ